MLKAYAKQQTESTNERGEMVQAIPAADRIPFGIRAIESGREVNGIWNSNASTPLQAPGSRKVSGERATETETETQTETQTVTQTEATPYQAPHANCQPYYCL
jgi:hypothetical protein